MKEIILCKYGEIVLKGLNRGHFESLLEQDMRKRLKKIGNYKVTRAQSTLYIEALDDFSDIEDAVVCAKKVFGFAAISRACVCEKNMDSILAAAKEYLPPLLAGAKTFKAEAKRSDKTFALKSPEISALTGGAVLETMPRLKVDVNNPDVTVRVEIRETAAYIHAGAEKGAGGVPAGCAGKALLLLSGGIDSPVAGYMMAKRGCTLEAVHFESFPYTSERAREKVMDLAKLVSEYSGKIRVHVISLTKIQETLVNTCEEEYFTLLLRRFMMRLAQRTAERVGAQALITGESLGQVASQTLHAIGTTDAVVDLPIFRPLVGMDKEEIIQIARKIDTFDTSILPYEDCCTVFTPKHPKTRPELAKVEAEEAKLDVKALEDEAFLTMTTRTFALY